MHCTQPDWQSWLQIFQTRRDRPLPELDPDCDYGNLPDSLARSLAVFQLGESGGGSVIAQARASQLDGVDEDYARALELFVAEEHRHANILAICVRLLNGELLRQNWTARLFVFGRRLMGLRLKILVLLAAEVVGLCYYRLIASRLPPGNMHSWLMDMIADEEDHLAFHCAFLESQTSNRTKQLIFKVSWRSLMALSQQVVLLDHRQALHDLGLRERDVRSLWRGYARTVENRVLDSSAGNCFATGSVPDNAF